MDSPKNLSDSRTKSADEVLELTEKYVNDLINIWKETFDNEILEYNLKKLADHTAKFFEEIVSESIQRQEFVKEKIESLKNEMINLKRLLKKDIDLSIPERIPLCTVENILDQGMKNLRDEFNARRNEIFELLLEQSDLCDVLGEPEKPLLDDPLPTEEELREFREHLDGLRTEKVNRRYEVNTLRQEVKSFLESLELPIQDENDKKLLNDPEILLTRENINRLKEMREEFMNQLEEVRNSIEGMKKKLEVLWDCLETSPSVREKFNKYTDFSQTTYDVYFREVDRCQNQKRQHIKKFVDKIREEIKLWWDKTLKSDLERSRFTNFTNDCYTEDLLTLHEMELDNIQAFYYDNEKIFKLFAERKTLWDRMTALEAKASEPGRYTNRGGQLLKEEKERKTLCAKLPKIEEQLTALVQEYEEQNNRKFLVFGEDILDVIAKDWDIKRKAKEKLTSARKNGGTPIHRTVTRTPLSARNHVSSAIKKMHQTNLSSVPATFKRKADPAEMAHTSVKRNLIMEYNSPNIFLKPQSINSRQKSPKRKVIATTLKRRSARLSGGGNSSKRRKTPRKLPKIVVSSEESVTSETVSYDDFEEYIENDPNTRSSIVNDGNTRNKRKQLNKFPLALPDPRLLRTPSKVNLLSNSHKSPGTSRTGSPMVPTSNRKLTTKNLPIII